MSKFLDDYQMIDAIANRMRHSGILEQSGNSVHEFLGNATPENAPRTIQRAIVGFKYNPLHSILNDGEELWTRDGLLFLLEMDFRTMGSTFTVKTYRTDSNGNRQTLITFEYSYFDPTFELLAEAARFIVRCLTEGDWASQNKNRTLLAPVKTAA